MVRVTDEQLSKLLEAFKQSQGFEWSEHDEIPDDWWLAHSLKISREAVPALAADLQDARAEIERLKKIEHAAMEYKIAHRLASDLTVTNHQETQRRSNACRRAWERLMLALGGES